MNPFDALSIPDGIMYDAAMSYCPVCSASVDRFRPFGKPRRDNARCPNCGSLERHRLVWCFFRLWTNLFDGRAKSVLHIAPEPAMSERIGAIPGVDYLTADLESPLAMVKMDLTDIQYPDNSFDVILCSHVLEHIPDDVTAMREMRRVLKPNGWAAVQVPVYGNETYENWDAVSEEDRVVHFGQRDHVRKYGVDIADRLRRAGFDVKHRRPMSELGPELAKKMAIKNQDIFYCIKRRDGI